MSPTIPDETLAAVCIDTLEQHLKAPLRPLTPRARVAFRRAVLTVPGPSPFAVTVAADRSSCHALAKTQGDGSQGSADRALRELVEVVAQRLRPLLGEQQPLGRSRVLDGLWSWAGVATTRSRLALHVEGWDATLDVELCRGQPL